MKKKYIQLNQQKIKAYIPYVIIVILIISIVCVWLLMFQGKEDRFTNDIISGIELFSGSKNLLQRMLGNNSKIEFNINKESTYKLKIPDYTDYNFSGKGLVIAASANKYRYVSGLYTNLYVIRRVFNSNIPIEIFYVGESEKFQNSLYNLIIGLGNIKIYNLLDKLNTNTVEEELRGYQTKPLAALCSSFEEVIIMDADALCFIDPILLFNADGYNSNGMILFRDYVDCMKFISKEFIDEIGIGSEKYCQKTNGYEIDSSCIIFNKKKYWNAIFTICLINVKSDVYYKYKKNVLGDKDTWLIGSMFVGLNPYISGPKPSVLITGSGRQILGHMQSLLFNGGSVNVYYNNQMVDFKTADVSNWTYKVEKNPRVMNNVSPGFPLTKNMHQAFEGAKIAMIDLLKVLPSSMNNNSDTIDGTTKGFIKN